MDFGGTRFLGAGVGIRGSGGGFFGSKVLGVRGFGGIIRACKCVLCEKVRKVRENALKTVEQN